MVSSNDSVVHVLTSKAVWDCCFIHKGEGEVFSWGDDAMRSGVMGLGQVFHSDKPRKV